MPPKVSIIVTAYNPSAKPYLDLCIKSIHNLDYDNKEVIIVGKEGYKPEYYGARTVAPAVPEFYPPVGLNYGIGCASDDSKYYFVINDDVILTKNCLTNLVTSSENNPVIGLLMPYGNDVQNLPVGITPIPPGGYRIDSMPAIIDMMNTDAFYKDVVLFTQGLCLYAVLISKENFKKIGPFDEGLIGMDDIDYSIRSREAGLHNCVTYDSLVFHAGGASTSNSWTDELRQKSKDLFTAKWERHGGWRS